MQKVAKNRHLGTIAHLFRAISSQLRQASTIGKKNLLSSNMSSRCPHNILNFGPLAAEICLPVWGTPANFNGFRDLAALQLTARQSSSERQPNFAALNRGRHLCSAGKLRWALAHSFFCSTGMTGGLLKILVQIVPRGSLLEQLEEQLMGKIVSPGK